MPLLQLRLFDLPPVPGGVKRSSRWSFKARRPRPPRVHIERVRPFRPRRESTHRSSYKHVRYVGRGWYQARVWIGPRGALVDSVNLGLYRTEWDAWRAVKAWVAAGADPCRGLPEKVLPKWVRRRDDGYYATAKIERADRGVAPGRVTLGPYADPVEAHRAMLAVLAPTPRVPEPPRVR